MKPARHLSILAIGLSLFACSSGDQKNDGEEGGKKDGMSAEMKEVKELQKEVMEGHDTLMPKMKEIKGLKQEAKAMGDSLREAGDTALATRMDKTVTRLEEGHESMMEWMRQFDKPFMVEQDTLKASGPEEAIDYLEKQQEKVSSMERTMMDAMDSARSRLDSLAE